jgi:hypothetical protein
MEEKEYTCTAEMICAEEAAIIERRDRAFDAIRENLRLMNYRPTKD